jgi:hypothetical protein
LSKFNLDDKFRDKKDNKKEDNALINFPIRTKSSLNNPNPTSHLGPSKNTLILKPIVKEDFNHARFLNNNTTVSSPIRTKGSLNNPNLTSYLGPSKGALILKPTYL